MLRALPAPELSIGAVLVGSDLSSKSFMRQKRIAADFLGIRFEVRELPQESTTDEVLAVVVELGNDRAVGGIIIQLPLPQQVNRSRVLAAVPADKDVDCLTPQNLAAFGQGSDLMPPAAGALEAIARSLMLRLGSVRAAVVGSGLLVGRPAATFLATRAKSVEVIGEGGELAHLLRADLVVSGTGKKNLITADLVRPGAVVIDFGYPHDADFEAIAAKGGIVTPTPGGTGPIVVAKLFENFYRLQHLFPPQ